MPDPIVAPTIKLGELETLMKGWGQGLLAEMQKTPLAVAKAAAAQDPVPVEAKVDGVPKPAELVKPGQADMKAAGIAGVVESGDNLKILQFRLGPITSALVGVPTGLVASSAIDAWILPYRTATGPTATRPATVGFAQINWLNPAAHVGAMVLSETYVAGFLGRTAAHFITGTLLINTLLKYTPLGVWLENLVKAISPKTTTTAQARASQEQAAQARASQNVLQRGAQNGRTALSWR